MTDQFPEVTLTELFEEQVVRGGDRVAVVCGEESVSYAELNARANRVARWLLGRGVGVEDRVAVSLPRSVDLVVALLGVVKAGAVYVPVDRIIRWSVVSFCWRTRRRCVWWMRRWWRGPRGCRRGMCRPGSGRVWCRRGRLRM